MPHPTSKLIIFLGICLLAAQVSGLHLHSSADGTGDTHGHHVHAVDAQGHDHESDTDVAFLESATGWVKSVPFVLLFTAAVFAVPGYSRGTWRPIVEVFHRSNTARWRPPLRAPPPVR
jgi:hypothetical protein